MASVFISYCSPDRPFVLRLAESLKANGQDVWLDQWRITGRDPYWDEIQRGIESTTHFIFVISPDSVNKESTNGARKELYHAAGLVNGPVIIPVMARETPFADLPIVITPGMYEIYDFVHQPYEQMVSAVLLVLNTVATPISKGSTVRVDAPITQNAPSLAAAIAQRRTRLPLIGAVVAVMLIGLVVGYKVLNTAPPATATPTASATRMLALMASPTQAIISDVSPTLTPAVPIPPTIMPTLIPIMPTTVPTVPTIAPTDPVASSSISPKVVFFHEGVNTLITGYLGEYGFVQLPKAGDSYNANWTQSAGTTNGLVVWYFQDGGTYEVGHVDNDGTYQVLKVDSLALTGYKYLIGLANQMVMFYNADYGRCVIKKVGSSDGSLTTVYNDVCPANAALIVAATDGQLVLFYSAADAQVISEKVSIDGTAMTPGATSSLGTPQPWVSLTEIGGNRVLFYAANGTGAVFQIDNTGKLSLISSSTSAYGVGWTHIVHSGDPILFYNANATSNAALYGTFDKDAHLVTGAPQELNNAWTLIVSTH